MTALLAAQLPGWLAWDPLWAGCLAAVPAVWVALRLNRTASGEMASSRVAGAPLVGEVLPVWRRHIERAKGHSEDSIGGILASFGAIAERLDQAVRMTQGSQARSADHPSADELVRRNDDALAQMLRPMREAVQAREEVYTRLDLLGEAMSELRQTAQQIKQLARRINMVALNASVEASRAGERGAGFAVVAQEVRQLAAQSADAANRMTTRTSGIDAELQSLRSRAAAYDSSEEALRDQASAGARAVVGGLLQNLSEVDRSSRELQEAGAAMHAEFERVLMNFQAQDRLSQMLSCVTADIERLGDWLREGGDLSATQAGEWLARLDASYTMEEQRAQHHGNTAIQRDTGIEFF